MALLPKTKFIFSYALKTNKQTATNWKLFTYTEKQLENALCKRLPTEIFELEESDN